MVVGFLVSMLLMNINECLLKLEVSPCYPNDYTEQINMRGQNHKHMVCPVTMNIVYNEKIYIYI